MAVLKKTFKSKQEYSNKKYNIQSRLAYIALLLFSWRVCIHTKVSAILFLVNFLRGVWWSWYAVSLLHLGLELSNTMAHDLAYDLSRYLCCYNWILTCEPSCPIHLKSCNAFCWQVFVANHTSMIDFIVLEQMTAFAVIMQKHPGWVGKKSKAFALFACSFCESLKNYCSFNMKTSILNGKT